MTNELLNKEVARITGEDLSTIEHLGFSWGAPTGNPSLPQLPYRSEISEVVRDHKPGSLVDR